MVPHLQLHYFSQNYDLKSMSKSMQNPAVVTLLSALCGKPLQAAIIDSGAKTKQGLGAVFKYAHSDVLGVPCE